MNDKYVYYVCYGSNLHFNRFQEYLEKSSWYTTSFRSTLSKEDRAIFDEWAQEENTQVESYRVNLNHDVYFSGYSGRWKGGIAYLDVDSFSCKKIYRAYKITRDQFESLFSQENGYYRGTFDWDKILSHRETIMNTYFYSRIVNLGNIKGIPALTFTNEDSLSSLRKVKNGLTPPGEPYLDVINRGRAETRKLPFRQITPFTV